MPKAAQTDLVYLDQLLTTLKRHGVTQFSDDYFRLDLAAPTPQFAAAQSFARPTADEMAEDDEEEKRYRRELADWAAKHGRDPDEALDDGPA